MSHKSAKRLIVVDISSFIFRAYHAIRPLNAPDGTPVNAVSGVLSMLLKMLSDYRPDHILLARDTRGGSFRNEMYSLYKANRSEPPDELIPQFPLIEQLIEKLEIPSCQIPGFEADDIIGSVVTQWAPHFDEILIASGDKDLMQFVNEKVKMLDTQKDIIYGPQQVFDKMGVWPNQIVDYLSIIGDTSDNVPGMKGIGAVGASKLLAQYQTLDQIIEHKEELTGKKVIEAFSTYLEDGLLSRRLIKIPTDIELPIQVEQSSYLFTPKEELYQFLQHLGFRSAVSRIQNLSKIDSFVQEEKNTAPEVVPAVTMEEISCSQLLATDDNFSSFLEQLKGTSQAAIYLLYSSEEVVDKSLVSMSICFDEDHIWTLPFGMTPFTGIANLSEDKFKQIFELISSRKNFDLISFDAKSFYHLWPWMDDLTFSKLWDIQQLNFLRNPDGKHELGLVLQELTGFSLPVFSKKMAMSDGTEQDLNAWSALPAKLLANAFVTLKTQLSSDLFELYAQIDGPLMAVLGRMERRGICLNPPYLKKLQGELEGEILAIEEEISAISGEQINLRSPKQVGKLLFEDLKLPALKKTKTGYSTNSEVLEQLMEEHSHPVLEKILKFRELDKINSTYVSALPQLISPKTGRIHTHFNTHVAATGRLSSTAPNLQNIPVRSPTGKKVRKAFIATRGQILLSADYSQVELRLLAHFSQDPTMLKAFGHGDDIHAQTAAEILQVPLDKVSSDDRRLAKAVNFGLMYGQSSFGLAKTLGISRGEAFEYITRYFERFGSIKGYLDHLKEKCEASGTTTTLHGRKRLLPDIHATNRNIKSFAEREAINTPIQGTAADIIKLAMIEIDRVMRERQMKSQMLLQVHDELIFEVVEEELEEMKKLVRQKMEGVVSLSVPLKVDMGIGVNWYDLK